MQYIYRIRTDTVKDEDGKEYTVYGIEALNVLGIPIKSVPDIFFDYDRACEFVNLCNTCQINISHLMNVIEDELI